MPQAASADGVELLELRVLDGPNRFFTRPAVKLEFGADEPGVAAEVATAAGESFGTCTPPWSSARRGSRPATRTTTCGRRSPSRGTVAPSPRRWVPPPRGWRSGITTERRELRALRAIALGPRPHLPTPHVPVVAVTGTNGKSTTTRLIAHIAREAGRRVGMTNSDGIYVRDELVEPGDWTGFGGAGRVLAEPGLQLAVLETARGGILLRGIGYAGQRRGGGHQRLRRPSWPAGDRHRSTSWRR